MNYEDRADLLPPEEVVSATLWAKLRGLNGPTLATLGLQALTERTPTPGSMAYEAIRTRVQADTAPEKGAPPEAAALEEDAMLCGYRFGRLALGPLRSSHIVSLRKLVDRVDSMFLYALPGQASEGLVGSIIDRNVPSPTGAHEEAAGWAWAFGLGVAVVETDLAAGDG